MSAKYIQPGKAIDIVASANIAANDVVTFGGIVGVAHDPITSGGSGAIQIEGVFELPKDGAAASGGVAVFWDPTSGYATVTSSAGRVACGKTVAPAAASATVVLVKLNA